MKATRPSTGLVSMAMLHIWILPMLKVSALLKGDFNHS